MFLGPADILGSGQRPLSATTEDLENAYAGFYPNLKKMHHSTNSLLVEGNYKSGEPLEADNNATATAEALGTDVHGYSDRNFP